MLYDVAIIGAGASGAATARELSRYRLKTILIESAREVCAGVSKANSGIVHAGFHHTPGTLKSRLEMRGNFLFDKLHAELHFPYLRCGILTAAYSAEEMETVKSLYQRGLANGVRDMELCSKERMLELEEKLCDTVVGGLFAPNSGTVEPYNYVFSLVESSCLNGVHLACDFKVVSGTYHDGHWQISSDKGDQITAKFVVNAAGLCADEVSRAFGAEDFTITARKGEEYLLDRNSPARPTHIVFPVPAKNSKGVLIIPTAGGTTMLGPTAEMTDDKHDTETTSNHLSEILSLVTKMVRGVNPRDIITSFAGNRPTLPGDDFYIAPSGKAPSFIQAAGIQSPGLTASPAIGEYIAELLRNCGLEMVEKDDFIPTLPEKYELRNSDKETINALHAQNPAYTNIVCRCEKISEAEIIEAVKRGHTTVDGVKFYTRAGMGRCQGGFCGEKILKIISRESGIPIEELEKRGCRDRVLAGTLGDLEVKL